MYLPLSFTIWSGRGLRYRESRQVVKLPQERPTAPRAIVARRRRTNSWNPLAVIPRSKPDESAVHILYLSEHADYVAVNKPSGMLVHRNEELAKNERVFVKDVTRRILAAEHGIDEPVFVVHRLDRATSGVMLFALGSRERAAALQASLQNVNETDKQYWALARAPAGHEMPAFWTNEHPLKDLSKPSRGGGAQQSAHTSFTCLLALDGASVSAAGRCDGDGDGYARDDEEAEPDAETEAHSVCVVRAQLRTGRRHQVRRHLANGRFPVLGDTSYGKGRHNREARRLYGAERLALHARRLTFREPGGARLVTIEAPVPPELRTVLARVPGFDAACHAEMCDIGS